MANGTGSPQRVNRRKHPRYALELSGSAWTMSRVALGPFPVKTSDISLGGLKIHVQSEPASVLEEGDQLLLGFPLPDSRGDVSLRGRVVWKRRGLMTLLGAFALGVEFFDTPEAEIRRLLDPLTATADPLAEHP